LLLAINVLWPRHAPSLVSVVSFFASWLAGELSLHVVIVEVVCTLALVYRGALESWLGIAGLVLMLVALAIQGFGLVVSHRSAAVVAQALDAIAAAPHVPSTEDRAWRQLLFPFPVRDARVERTRDVPYFTDAQSSLYLDVFRLRDAKPSTPRPIVLHVHGGGWTISDKRWEGLPMLLRLAAHGWLGFSANYRLSPRATFPDHIVDVKRAIAWVRAHAAELGGDPNLIVLSGGSAGAHLASLAALSASSRQWQPGFEDADTTVAGCVCAYGVYDLTDAYHARNNPGLGRLLERHVLKQKEAEDPKPFVEASPIHWIDRCPSVPPFLVLHGTNDVLLPVPTARAFVAALKHAGVADCAYVELPLAQHALDIFPSVRCTAVVDGIERFLAHVRKVNAGRRPRT